MPGLLDTVKFKGEFHIHEKDRENLRSKLKYQHQKNVRVVEDDLGQEVIIREMYSDEKTGIRVMVDEWQTKIEASIPRVLGISNDRQETLTESDTRAAIQKMTVGLLPYTSEINRCGWGLTRLDLARNFEGNIPLVVNAYGNLKHPEVRRQTKLVFSESVMFYGNQREIVVYDKGLEMGKEAGRLGRAECRWKGVKGIDKFLGKMAEQGKTPVHMLDEENLFCLPIYMKDSYSVTGRRIWYIETDFKRMNQIMRDDLEKLGAPGQVKTFRTTTEIALDAMMNHSEEYMSYYWAMSRASKKRWRKLFKQFKERHEQIDIVKLIDWESRAAA